MNIAFDLDGVLTHNFHVRVYRECWLDGKTKSSFADFWAEEFPNFSQKVQKYYTLNPIYYGVDPISDETKEILRKLNHNLFYITSRDKSLITDTTIWFEKQKLPDFHELYFSTNKANEVMEKEIELFVDDQPQNFQNLTGICQCILFHQPWNTAANYPRIYHLKEILEYVN